MPDNPLTGVPQFHVANEVDKNFALGIAKVDATWDAAKGKYFLNINFEIGVDVDNRISNMTAPFTGVANTEYAVYQPGSVTPTGEQTPNAFFRSNGDGALELLISNVPVNVVKGRHEN